MQKDFTQTTDAEAIELLNKEVAELRKKNEELKSGVRLPYNPDTIDAFLDSHEWCRTAKFNEKN